MNFLEMWLGFILMGIALVFVTILAVFEVDLIFEIFCGESMLANILFHCKTYEEVLDKLKQKIKNRIGRKK